MAVLQISKIQVRRGQKAQSGIPTLSAGEFAWAVDAQELYIGNGSVSEGSPYVGNTRLLTELDATNLFKLANTYTYEGNGNATIITGVDANSPVQRTLQDKLDDFVSLADFGAVGDGVTNDTKALQRAIDQLYLNSDKAIPSARKKLRFPAGTYLITGTIYIPSYATIEGDGIDRTIIKQSTTATAVFQTIDFSSTPSSRVVFPSIQSTTQPKNISLAGMTLQYDNSAKQSGALMYLDCALDTEIKNVKFLGLAASPANDEQESINIRGQGATTTHRLKIRDCEFKNISRGIVSDYDVTDIDISSNKFDTLYHGILFGETLSGLAPTAYGPRKVLIEKNTFDNVYKYAVYNGQNSTNTPCYIRTQSNKFYNCGNNGDISMEEAQRWPIIVIETPGGKSTDDEFSRTFENLSGVAGTLVPEIFGHVSYQPLTTQSLTLPVSSLPTTIAVIPKYTASFMAFEYKVTIDYVARQPALNVTRAGQATVITNYTTATWTDSFQYAGATSLTGDIQFTANLNTTTQALTISVLNPVGSVDTTFTYQYNVLY